LTSTLRVALALLLAAPVFAGEFKPGRHPQYGLARYRVSVALNGSEDLETLTRQLAATYRATIEPAADASFAGFTASMTERSAKMLSEHPRVLVVEQIAPHNGNETWTTGTYAYDGAGNIKSIGAEKFTYDAFGRLTKGGSGGGHHQSYTYDRYGNILTITTDGNTATQLKLGVDPASNRISNSASPYNVWGQYDLAGRMTNYQGTRVFVYDALSMIKESTVDGERKLFLYTPKDERLAAITVNAAGAEIYSIWTVRDTSAKVLRRFSRNGGTWKWQEDYIHRDGQLLAAELPGGARRHFHPDHLGTPRLITNENGTRIATHHYYPFGLEQTSPLQDSEAMKFTGHERDTPFLDYMHARSYLAAAGRFLSVDPIIAPYAAQAPQAWNRYSYALNNPIRFTDPTGLIADCKPETITDEDGKKTTRLRCAEGESSTVTAERPHFSFFSWPQFSALRNLAANRTEPKAPSQTPAQPPNTAQCKELNALLAAESQQGTANAAARLNNTTGYGLPAFYNDAGGVYRNIVLANGDELDVDWFVDLQQARAATGGPVGAAYILGKSGASVGKALRGQKSGYPVPFTDPGELTALTYAREGRAFRDVFTPAYMESACQ
jgi:RHS repeat-associated protein